MAFKLGEGLFATVFSTCPVYSSNVITSEDKTMITNY